MQSYFHGTILYKKYVGTKAKILWNQHFCYIKEANCEMISRNIFSSENLTVRLNNSYFHITDINKEMAKMIHPNLTSKLYLERCFKAVWPINNCVNLLLYITKWTKRPKIEILEQYNYNVCNIRNNRNNRNVRIFFQK